MKAAFNRQLDALASLWQEPAPNERVYFLGEAPGRPLAVYYCCVKDIAALSETWTLLKLPDGDHALPRLHTINKPEVK